LIKQVLHRANIFIALSLLFAIVISIALFIWGDKKILFSINQAHTLFWDRAMYIISIYGRGDFLALYFLMVFLFAKQCRNIFFIISTGLFGLIIGLSCLALKVIINKPRPLSTYPGELFINIYTENAFDYSMPSGHTWGIFSFCSFILIAFNAYPKYAQIILFVLSAMVGISRIYLAQHFASDVLAGCVLGIISGSIIGYFVNKFRAKYKYLN
jgi:membrane-associated phospholipid phosphatase